MVVVVVVVVVEVTDGTKVMLSGAVGSPTREIGSESVSMKV